MKIGFAALAALMAVSPALAAPGDDALSAKSTVLNLRGLDLASVEGQQRLAIRMDQAANTVCGDERVDTIHLALGAQARACHADVIAEIRSRISAATATAAREPASTTQIALR